jgi:hypothetical protein
MKDPFSIPPSPPFVLNRGITTHLATHLPTRHAPPRRSVRRVGAAVQSLARGVALLQQLADMRVQPNTLQIPLGHILGAGNNPMAQSLSTQALERLGHIPLGARIEKSQLVAGLEAHGARKNRERARVEDLLLARGRQRVVYRGGLRGRERGWARTSG